MVKKIFSAIAAFAVLFTACETLTGEQTGKFHITSKTTIEAAAGGNCYSIDFVIDEAVEGAKVTATASHDWIKDVAVGEQNVSFCVKANEGEARTGYVELVYAGAKAKVTINQEAAAASKIRITSATTVDVAAEGNCLIVSYELVELEGATVEATPSADWIYNISVDQANNSATYCVKVNEGEARTAELTLSYAGDEAVVTVNQAAL